MARKADDFAGLSANRLCVLTGVRPQTRGAWKDRGLLRDAQFYGQLDLIEQAVVKALLETIPKGQVEFVWHEVRPRLRDFVAGPRAALVWDAETQTACVTRTDAELSDAVRHGRPVYVIPLGELVARARKRWQTEVSAARRARSSKRRPASPMTADRSSGKTG